MSRFTQLSAAIAVALGVNLTPAHAAPIEFKPDGIGDALLFPAYVGLFDNWITLQNNSDLWLQGHLRFRGAAWGGEVLSFDVILLPRDVMVFRLADVDGDGQWEIDQKADPLNFRYTSLNSPCGDGTVDNCMEALNALEPADGVVSEAMIQQQRNIGYIEFIGECELRGMTVPRMSALLAGATVGMHPRSLTNITDGYGANEGTNCWAWSDAGEAFAQDTNGPGGTYGLDDFPNVVSGNAFIRIPGQTTGLAYNADALADFRTASHPHRVDSYRILSDGNNLDAGDAEATQRNRAVIVHEPDPNASDGQGTPFGHYLYRFAANISSGNPVENRRDETLTSFLTTFGPTLADGDDYDLTGNFETLISGESRNVYHQPGALRSTSPDDPSKDDWDVSRINTDVGPGTAGDGSINSIGEVEEAIRIGGQTFSSFYVDNNSAFGSGNSLTTWYFGLFPTKIFYAENPEMLSTAAGQTALDYRNVVVPYLLQLDKEVDVAFGDIFTAYGGTSSSSFVSYPTPPYIPPEFMFKQTLPVFNIDDFFKSAFNNVSAFRAGRAVVQMRFNEPLSNIQDDAGTLNAVIKSSWPGLFYAFEVGQGFGTWGHWRRLQRCRANNATSSFLSCQEN